MNWERFFDEDRLIRGYDYFLKDKVFDVIITDNYISSKVEGKKNNIYEVQINYENNDIKSAFCTCPYSYSKTYCKHMVATLYKSDEINQNKNNNINNAGNTYLFKDLLSEIDENKLKKYIYDTYKEDTEFIDKFVHEFYSTFTYDDFKDYEDNLNNIFKIDLVELYNENGFYQESPYHKYLLNFINTKIDSLYNNKQYEYVLMLIYSIYENISNKKDINEFLDVEDILTSCNYYFKRIIELNEKNLNIQIYDYILSNLRYNYDYYISSNLVKIALNKNDSHEYLKQLNDAIDLLLNKDIDINEDLLVSKFYIIKKLDYPENDLEQYLYKYRSNYKIMDLLINQKIKDNHLDTAIELLNENRNFHGSLYSLEDTITLIDLYLFKNDFVNAVNEIKKIIYEFNIKDIQYVNQLKEYQTHEEWILSRKDLIKYYSDNHEYEYLNQIYINEELFDELYNNLKDNCQLNILENYREYIDEKYYEDILLLYKKDILDRAKSAKNISAYSVIINQLNIMLSYPNSKELVTELIRVLKNKYKNKELLIRKLNEINV